MRLFYTSPLAIVDRPADALHYTPGRRGFAPRWIVLHHTGGVDSLAWLTNDRNSRVSAHRLINRGGVIYKLVRDADTAWAAGYGIIGPVDPDGSDPAGVAPNLNISSLNIEIENTGNGRQSYPLIQMQAVARQVVEWIGAYGWLPVVGHGEVDARKNDPLAFDWTLLHSLMRDYISEALRQGGSIN